MTTDQPPEAGQPLTAEQRATVTALLSSEQQPATAALVLSLAETVRNRRQHDHPKWEDLYCLNQVSYAGERTAPLLRRLLDAEAEVERLRSELAARPAAPENRRAPTHAEQPAALASPRSTAGNGKVTPAAGGGGITRAAILREEARRLRRLEAAMPAAGRARQGPGLLRAALVIDEQADLAQSTTPGPGQSQPWTSRLDERDQRSMLAAIGAPRPPAEPLAEIEHVYTAYRQLVDTNSAKPAADTTQPEPDQAHHQDEEAQQ